MRWFDMSGPINYISSYDLYLIFLVNRVPVSPTPYQIAAITFFPSPFPLATYLDTQLFAQIIHLL